MSQHYTGNATLVNPLKFPFTKINEALEYTWKFNEVFPVNINSLLQF